MNIKLVSNIVKKNKRYAGSFTYISVVYGDAGQSVNI